LITLANQESDFYRLDPAVRRVGLDLTGDSRGLAEAVTGNIARVRALAKSFRLLATDAVISFITQVNVPAIFAAASARCPVIVSERVDPRQHKDSAVWRLMRRLTYPRADAVVVQTEDIARWMSHMVVAGRLYTIPNPILEPAETAMSGLTHRSASRPYVMAMGRLTHQKGFDVLLEAYAGIEARNDVDLLIAGEGPEHGALVARAAELRIAERVHFVGRIDQPLHFLRNAVAFVLSSRYEGFPNVLAEAMSVGTPVVAFDCPTGPRDLIRNEIDGILVPAGDCAGLARALDRVLRDATLRRELGEAAKSVVSRFSLDRVLGMWDSLIAKVVLGSRG
jgi:glycosyltransferase involved in cell wall biosynthesis